VGDVFKALADPTRRIILDELTDRNGQTLFEICSRLTTKHHLGSSRQAISQHLDVLETAGLVETRREGRYKFHYINTRPLEPIIERWLKKPGRTPEALTAAHRYRREGDRHENQPGERAR
jgi:DNA-binding transcriptional ArsR family regulator